jgi:hypothetical protein
MKKILVISTLTATLVLTSCAHQAKNHQEFPNGTYIDCKTDENSPSFFNSAVVTGCVSNKLASPAIFVGAGTSMAQVAETTATTALGMIPKVSKPTPKATPTPERNTK